MDPTEELNEGPFTRKEKNIMPSHIAYFFCEREIDLFDFF